MIGLVIAFFGTALLYAAVGFGGGSTFNALLVLSGADYRAIPAIALVCNVAVVAVGSWRFAAAGHVHWRRIWPLFTLSVPMAWVGGRMPIAEIDFVGLLALALFAAAIAMLLQRDREQALVAARSQAATWVEPLTGGSLGLLAGLVGIGGGIFLAPVLHLLRWGGAKAIAGTCAVFILVNSIAGLAGQFAKSDGFNRADALAAHWPLFPAVMIGGAIGAMIGSGPLKPAYVRLATALLILYVAVRLGWRFRVLLAG